MNESEKLDLNRLKYIMLFATHWHGDQKYGPYPYTRHLSDVFRIAVEEGLDNDVVIAAWLHDILEDTKVGIGRLTSAAGPEIAALVEAVTDEPGRNRRERKAKTLPKTRAAGTNAVALKLCDRIANMENSKAEGDPRGLLKMYRKEHAAFTAALYIPGELDDLWSRLEALQ